MNWHALGEKIGDVIGKALLPIGGAVRAHYAAKYGSCRRCETPLGGPSPHQLCEGCHGAEVREALGMESGE